MGGEEPRGSPLSRSNRNARRLVRDATSYISTIRSGSANPGALRVEADAVTQAYAVADVVPEHLTEVRAAKLALIAKTEAAVKDRLTKELALEEGAGKTGAHLNSGEARRRADMLQRRLQKRLQELKRDAQILYSLNKPDDFILALVLFGGGGDDTPRVRYVRRPFQREPDFGAASVN